VSFFLNNLYIATLRMIENIRHQGKMVLCLSCEKKGTKLTIFKWLTFITRGILTCFWKGGMLMGLKCLKCLYFITLILWFHQGSTWLRRMGNLVSVWHKSFLQTIGLKNWYTLHTTQSSRMGKQMLISMLTYSCHSSCCSFIDFLYLSFCKTFSETKDWEK
jgi:hypothetical protein